MRRVWCNLVNIRGLGLRDPGSNPGTLIFKKVLVRPELADAVFQEDQ